jgi:hypothetical protein
VVVRAADAGNHARSLESRPGVAEVAPPRRLGEGEWIVDVFPAQPVLEDASLDLVRAIRDGPAPGEVEVTGDAAEFVDQQESLGDRLPLALAILALTTLAIVFGLSTDYGVFLLARIKEPRRRGIERGGGRARARADRADRHRGRPAVHDRDRCDSPRRASSS